MNIDIKQYTCIYFLMIKFLPMLLNDFISWYIQVLYHLVSLISMWSLLKHAAVYNYHSDYVKTHSSDRSVAKSMLVAYHRLDPWALLSANDTFVPFPLPWWDCEIPSCMPNVLLVFCFSTENPEYLEQVFYRKNWNKGKYCQQSTCEPQT